MADIGYGTILQRFTTEGVASTDPGIYVAVANVFNVDGPDLSRDDVETSVYDSADAYREYIPGLREPGEIAATLNLISTALSLQRLFHSTQMQTTGGTSAGGAVGSFAQSAAIADPTINWRLVGPNTDYWQFQAYVKGITQNQPIDDRRTWDVTFKLTGAPLYGHGAT
jgi:hypothetical protein